MTRWHAPACHAPDIIVDEATSMPSCRNCGLTPNIGDIIAHQGTSNSFPEPPPDELPGQMSLWWPPTVKYTTYDPDLNDMIASPSPSASGAMSGSSSPPQESDTGPTLCRTPIYPHPISPSQFRLAVLTPRASASSPVHLELETHSLLNHPQYETASYTWGGEDDNNERAQPIYIGDYWDVLLQTQNCRDLLRFLHPKRGVRWVWVDAVCINQLDVGERASQVAQMGMIYKQAFQTVVYLGPDLTPDLGDGNWPRMQRLHGVAEARIPAPTAEPEQEPGKSPILRRRYFSRLWIVQELVLSSRVVIRVGNVDYWATNSPGSLSSSSNEPEGPLAWALHLAMGNELDTPLTDLLGMTATLSCADPRDRIFGLLGIVGEASQRLEPNYSLSSRHVFTGLMADIIITRQFYHVLAYGSGVSSEPRSHIPSWVPDCRS
ncbi:heterokaryon incompatibility protein-domain-containing protein, partial [Cladorrhinum samala]